MHRRTFLKSHKQRWFNRTMQSVLKLWPVFLGTITFIGFLVSIKIDSEYTKRSLDRVIVLLEERSQDITNLDKRVTTIEYVLELNKK